MMAPRHKVFIKLITGIAVVLLLLGGFLFSAVAQAVSPTEAMAVGNENYEASNYERAIEVYQSIIEAGVENSDLYFNLGNAYFKQGDLGHAILNYRRAQRLDPRDADINANLTIARAQTLDKLEATSNSSLTNFVKVLEGWLTINEAAALALILWLLICATTVAAILFERLRQSCYWVMGVLAIFLAIGLISIANRYYIAYAYPYAVITAEEVDVTSGPGSGEQYLVEFNLHGGAEVQQLEARDNWRRIGLPGNNFQGWVPASAVELVAD